jgi:myosin heavy subunit|tara:strand:+ start:257 stop:703 length:447 start_codon:yes stop_codon:yes gene_type:complete
MAPLPGAANLSADKALGLGKGHSTVPDNCQLIELTDQTVITNLRRRYEQNGIYTFTGNILLAVNPYERLPIYNEKAMAAFPNNALSKNDPHVFATSEEAYQRINKDRRSQSIVVSGESGAGKTETNKCGPAQRSPYPQGWPASLSLIR